jgi:hypothetical protein
LSLHVSDFSMIFYEFSKFQLELIHYLRSYFRTGPWDSLVHTTIPLVRMKDPGKIADLAIGSSGMAGGSLAEIPTVRRHSWLGKWLGMTTSSRGIDLLQTLGRKQCRRARVVEPGGGDRGSRCSGEGSARPEQGAGLGALTRSREELRGVTQLRA